MFGTAIPGLIPGGGAISGLTQAIGGFADAARAKKDAKRARNQKRKAQERRKEARAGLDAFEFDIAQAERPCHRWHQTNRLIAYTGHTGY